MKTSVLSFFILLLACGILSAPASSQTKSLARDTLAFRTLLSDNIGYALEVRTLMRVYKRLTDRHPRGSERLSMRGDRMSGSRVTPVPEGKRISRGYWDGLDKTAFLIGRWSSGVGGGHLDSARFPDSLRHEMKDAFEQYHDEHPDEQAEKERLVRSLEAFDSLSINKPIFFATIHSTYCGNIRRYVDDLYKRSIMGNYRRLMRFCIRPTAKKLQKDLWVQFAIGLKLYNLWIERVRRGEISEQEEVPETPLTEQAMTAAKF